MDSRIEAGLGTSDKTSKTGSSLCHLQCTYLAAEDWLAARKSFQSSVVRRLSGSGELQNELLLRLQIVRAIKRIGVLFFHPTQKESGALRQIERSINARRMGWRFDDIRACPKKH